MNRRPFARRLGLYAAPVARLLSSATVGSAVAVARLGSLPALEIVDGWATPAWPSAARTEVRV